MVICIIKGAFVGKKEFDVIKMHGTTIKKNCGFSTRNASLGVGGVGVNRINLRAK
jgi:hypothetical protein